MADMIPSTNPITARAMIKGTAAMIRASRGVKSSVTDVRIGEIDSFRVAAEAYWTTVVDAIPMTARAFPLVVAMKSLTLSKTDINRIMLYAFINVCYVRTS